MNNPNKFSLTRILLTNFSKLYLPIDFQLLLTFQVPTKAPFYNAKLAIARLVPTLPALPIDLSISQL